jgi:glucose/arabinose dehydrogenase
MGNRSRDHIAAGIALVSLLGALVPVDAHGAAAVQAEDGRPRVPDGFRIEIFAEGLGAPTALASGPDGHLYVLDAGGGRVLRLADRDGDDRAEDVVPVVEALDAPFGIAWRGEELWVAEGRRVLRLGGVASGDPGPAVSVVEGLPVARPETRAFILGPAGRSFFVSTGSSCDLCGTADPRSGAVVRYTLDGATEQVWARGLGSAPGLAFAPVTGELWATGDEPDRLGDRVPRDELNVIRRGRHYGWPYCYAARVPSPEYADAARCEATEPPALTFPAGSSPRGIAFYSGGMFPPEYQGDAFVALSGSKVGGVAVGHEVVRVVFEDGRPVAVEDFVWGWSGRGGPVPGRPMQPLVGPDGALYVSDDYGGRVWRVSYPREEEVAALRGCESESRSGRWAGGGRDSGA